jgi:hypothetical protein
MKEILSTIIFVLLFCLSAFAQNGSSQCPLVTIFGPTSVAYPGDTMSFSVLIQGEGKNNLKYKWTVDKGTILEGQGTSAVHISTEGLSDVIITATFEIEGLPDSCQNKFQEVGVVVTIGCGLPADEYGKLPLEDELARMDAFLIELQINSEDQGFIWIKTGENETIEDVKKHVQKLVEHIKFRKVSIDKFIFAIEKSDSRMTRLMRISKTQELPECENCEIIKGWDLK